MFDGVFDAVAAMAVSCGIALMAQRKLVGTV
jgi:hypothetical protein